MFKKAFLILITAILIIEGGGCGTVSYTHLPSPRDPR